MFSKPYEGVQYFGIWAEERADRYGRRDALAVVKDALARCVDEDMRTRHDVMAALDYLEQQAVRQWPFQQFRKALENLDRQYGANERQLRHDITGLEVTLKESGRVKQWFMKMTGALPKDPEAELSAMRRNLENIEQRKAEARSGLEIQIEQRREELTRRQQMRNSPEPMPEREAIAPKPHSPAPPSRTPANDFGKVAAHEPPAREQRRAQGGRKPQQDRDDGPSHEY